MNYKRIAKTIIPQACVVLGLRAYRTWNRLLRGRRTIETKYEIVQFKGNGVDCFFGYYDISPFGTDSRVVYHEVNKSKDTCSIIMNNLEGSNRIVLSTTKAWNWQQGSRLRWFPNEHDVVIFNDMIENKYVSRLIDVKTGEEKQFGFPLYDISSDGLYGLSLDFTRLGYKRPGYGYTNLPFNPNEDIRDKGIDIYDLKEQSLLKTITYNEMSSALGLSANEYKHYYINHLSFSPSGKEFLFFFLRDTGNTFKASLLIYLISEETIVPLETEEKVSHYDWLDDNLIICTACDDKGHFHYYTYEVSNGRRLEVCPEFLEYDGHPSFINSNEIITDTYPDSKGYQHLKFVSLKEHTFNNIASVFDYKVKDVERRTDLHPRYHNNMISFDSNTSGLRSFNILFLR